MSTFVEPNPVDVLDPKLLMKVDPKYYGPKFQAVADLRALDDGTLHRGNEFRRVASLVNVPLAQAIRMTNPTFLRDKRAFYKWLNGEGAAYKTYEQKGGSRPAVTYTDGQGLAW